MTTAPSSAASMTAAPMTATPAPLRFEIPDDHPCLPGHFPGRPVVPGVVVLDRVFAAVEAASGALPSAAHDGAGHVRMPQVKFVQPLLPLQAARVELTALAPAEAATRAQRWRFSVLREADGAVLASGELQWFVETAAA